MDEDSNLRPLNKNVLIVEFVQVNPKFSLMKCKIIIIIF